jgi:hypothetical protein
MRSRVAARVLWLSWDAKTPDATAAELSFKNLRLDRFFIVIHLPEGLKVRVTAGEESAVNART